MMLQRFVSRICLGGILWLALAGLAAAQQISAPTTLALDPARTQIRYTISDMLHTVHGTFVMKSGEISFDPASGAAEGAIVIDASSGDSGNHTRDSRMKKDILQVRLYPEIDFIPQRIVGTVPSRGAGRFQVQGLCRIHGGEHPLTLDFTGEVTGAQFSGTTHVVIPYVAWGMKDPSTLFLRVSKQVALDISAVGELRQTGHR